MPAGRPADAILISGMTTRQNAERPVCPSLQELCAVNTAQPWCIDLIQPELSGGKTTARDLDVVAARPDATAIRVSGLDQKTFELLVTRYGPQFDAIYFWKDGRIADLTPLETLPQLRLSGFYVNHRTTRLWDLRRTPLLVGLRFENFTRLHALDDLAAGAALQELDFGDALWNTPVFDSLSPLAALGSLRRLSFNARRITDGKIGFQRRFLCQREPVIAAIRHNSTSVIEIGGSVNEDCHATSASCPGSVCRSSP